MFPFIEEILSIFTCFQFKNLFHSKTTDRPLHRCIVDDCRVAVVEIKVAAKHETG